MLVTFIVVTSLLTVAGASPAPQQENDMIIPVATADYDPCVVGGPRYYSYASNVHMFIDCGNAQIPALKTCPVHLVWNPKANYCDYPANVGVTSVTATAHPSISVQGPGIAGKHVFATGFALPCTHDRVDRRQMVWPYPGDVHYYIQCDSSGTSFIMACLPNHVYHDVYHACVSTQPQTKPTQSGVSTLPPITVPTGGTTVAGGYLVYSTGFSVPCTKEHVQQNSLYWPYPGHSHFYIQCDLFGDSFLMACQPGFNYYPASHTCVPGGTQSPLLSTQASFSTSRNPTPVLGSMFGTGFAAPCTQDVVTRGLLYWPYHGFPRVYIQCDLAGNAYIMGCQTGFIFYEKAHTCVREIVG